MKRKPKPRKKTAPKPKKTITKKALKKKSPRKSVRKSPKPKAGKKGVAKKGAGVPKIPGLLVGQVTHYFPHVEAAAVKITRAGLSRKDRIRIKGHTTDFETVVDSIQIDHAPVEKSRKGDEVGIQVPSRVREGDKVYKQ